MMRSQHNQNTSGSPFLEVTGKNCTPGYWRPSVPNASNELVLTGPAHSEEPGRPYTGVLWRCVKDTWGPTRPSQVVSA